MEAYQITEGIYWVGAIDWHLRSFHGYKTYRGTTYNAYLIIDNKITLIDTVKEKFSEEMLSRIRSVIDPNTIDYIISNHSEPDHSGTIKKVMQIADHAKVIASIHGVKTLKDLYGSVEAEAVRNGSELSLGKRTLKFYYTTMVHWPDSMVTYDPDDKILFSNDAFGQHLASSERFDGDYDLSVILQEARRYYANILLPYSDLATKVLSAVKALELRMILTGHGISWRDHLPDIFSLYEEMTSGKKKQKAVIVYDSMWGTTTAIASVLAETFIRNGIRTILYDISINDISDVMVEIMDAKYLAVGSATINSNILPPVAAFLCYLKGLAPENLKTIAFGSFGWGGQSIDLIEKELAAMKYPPLIGSIKVKYALSTDEKEMIESHLTDALRNENR